MLFVASWSFTQILISASTYTVYFVNLEWKKVWIKAFKYIAHSQIFSAAFVRLTSNIYMGKNQFSDLFFLWLTLFHSIWKTSLKGKICSINRGFKTFLERFFNNWQAATDIFNPVISSWTPSHLSTSVTLMEYWWSKSSYHFNCTNHYHTMFDSCQKILMARLDFGHNWELNCELSVFW